MNLTGESLLLLLLSLSLSLLSSLSFFISESGIFGVPLQNLLQEDKTRNEKAAAPSFFIEVHYFCRVFLSNAPI